MDYLPRPRNVPPEDFCVPLLAAVEYTPSSYRKFREFPWHHGFDFNKDRDRGHTDKEIASILQAWLYFGLLSEFLGQRVDKELFIRGNSVSGAALKDLGLELRGRADAFAHPFQWFYGRLFAAERVTQVIARACSAPESSGEGL